jgi:hypothetical protein
MQKKISEIVPITTPADTDLFLLSDVSESTSKRIAAGDLKDYIVDQDLFSDNVDSLVSALNSYNDGSGTNGLVSATALNANTLNNQAASYYLDYTNFQNTPTDLSDFSNTTGFIQYDDSVSPARLIYQETGQGTPITISTTQVTEGNNLYYTDDRVETYFDNNFADYYNQFSSTFDEGNIRNSITGQDGNFTGIVASQSDTIRITNTAVFDNFLEGQVIRVYGASVTTENEIDSISTQWSVSPNGFRTTGDDLVNFNYRICEFNLETGEISAASTNKQVTIGVPDELSGVVSSPTAVEEVFNLDYFITINLSGVPQNTGILIYRKTPNDTDYKLFSVLGTKEISNGLFIDYYNFDYTQWSGKNPNDNTYTSVIHFPLTSPSNKKRGWTDRIITGITKTSTTLDLKLETSVYVNGDTACQIVHNDTSKIQSSINNNLASDRKSVTLNPKTYVSSELLVPSNFSINGTPYITKIHRLPWSGYTSGVPKSSVISAVDSQNAENISIVGIDIEGNAPNQFLLDDSINVDVNYALDFGIRSNSILLDRVRITNVVGGGVTVSDSSNLRLVNSEIKNSGTTDRHVYSPLVADAGENTTVSENVFENFTNYVDVSVTNTGVITNNIVRNCGSGIFIYGSRFMISSPNVLIGPAGEFLPTPDTLNSEYDSVNIDLTEKFLANTTFTSPEFVYQENGQVYDLSASSGTLVYDTYFIQKLSNGVEEIYEANTGITINNVSAGVDPTVGQFKFSIPREDVQDIKLSTGAFSYSTLANTNPDHVGIAWSASCRQIVDDCTYDSGFVVANTDVYTISATGLQYASVGSEVQLNDDGGFSTGGINTIGIVTEVIRLNPQSNDYSVSIQFPGATLTQGTSGTLQYVDKFVLAQGRIL